MGSENQFTVTMTDGTVYNLTPHLPRHEDGTILGGHQGRLKALKELATPQHYNEYITALNQREEALERVHRRISRCSDSNIETGGRQL